MKTSVSLIKSGDIVHFVHKTNKTTIRAKIIEVNGKWITFKDLDYPNVGNCRFLKKITNYTILSKKDITT